MPFSDAHDLAEDMVDYPPRHVLAAAQAGIKPKSQAAQMTPGDFHELAAAVERVNG